MVLTQLITQRFTHLDIPTNYQYINGSTILILIGGFLNIILDVKLLIPCIHLYTTPTVVTSVL